MANTMGKVDKFAAPSVSSAGEVTTTSILSPAGGFMRDYDYTITPYVNCPFSCTYCYVPTLWYLHRLSKIWGGPALPKQNAPELLLRDARAGKLDGKRIYLSPNTDPYVPEERGKDQKYG